MSYLINSETNGSDTEWVNVLILGSHCQQQFAGTVCEGEWVAKKRKWRTTCKYRSPVEWAGNGAELSFPRSSIEAENRYSKLTENEQKKPLINRNGNGKWQENGSGVASLVSFFSHSLSLQICREISAENRHQIALEVVIHVGIS